MEVDLEQQQQYSAREKGKQPLAVQNDSLPWVEKYRPVHLDELVSHKEIISTIVKFIESGRMPHLLLYGPAGVGKTSAALACARRMYGDKQWRQMVLELNASDDRGIDVVREQIITFASTKQVSFSAQYQQQENSVKLIILDECDSMTQPAQAALRRVMEKYSRNVRFCLICNYVSKIIPAIQSRCTRFRFAPLEKAQVQDRLESVILQEKVNITADGRQALLKLSKGDMRRALNVLQSVHGAYNIVNEDNVYACVGSPLPKDVESVVKALLEKDFASAHEYVTALKLDKGLALNDLVTEVFQFIMLVDFPPMMKSYIVRELADLEHRVSGGCTEKIQTSALISAFQLGKEMAAKCV